MCIYILYAAGMLKLPRVCRATRLLRGDAAMLPFAAVVRTRKHAATSIAHKFSNAVRRRDSNIRAHVHRTIMRIIRVHRRRRRRSLCTPTTKDQPSHRRILYAECMRRFVCLLVCAMSHLLFIRVLLSTRDICCLNGLRTYAASISCVCVSLCVCVAKDTRYLLASSLDTLAGGFCCCCCCCDCDLWS